VRLTLGRVFLLSEVNGDNIMNDQGDNKNFSPSKAELFRMMETSAGFEIAPYDGVIDFENKSLFTKLELGSAQKTHVSVLLQHIPSATATCILKRRN
jgi:hypothetical protein